MIITPTQSNIQAAMVAFLGTILPDIEVVAGQDNRVPEPTQPDFIVMTPMRFERIATNLDVQEDCRITGSIFGLTLTVSAVAFGLVTPGATLVGSGVLPGTLIVSQLSGGSGGIGTYQLSQLTGTIGSETMACGQASMTQEATVTVQLDFHSADLTAGDMAEIFKTTFRSGFAVDFFGGLPAPLNGASPLYAEDPRQVPFINENQQYEWRWVVDALLQVNQTVIVPEQYADSVSVNVINVQAAYGP